MTLLGGVVRSLLRKMKCANRGPDRRGRVEARTALYTFRGPDVLGKTDISAHSRQLYPLRMLVITFAGFLRYGRLSEQQGESN
jgi:hypothetical protein